MSSAASSADATDPRADATAGFRLGMVAGETSGDLLAASVITGLQTLTKPAQSPECAGVGGPEMVARGFDAWWPSERLAVRGYVEVLKAYPGLYALRERLHQRMLAWHPDVFVGVDAPDFNLALERRLRGAGVRVAHFIGPSVWAWRAGRLQTLKQSVDHMLLIFPFEKRLYDEAGIPATYVGHPLADAIASEPDRGAARRALGLPEGAPIVAVMPGSRGSEITYNAPVFIQTMAWMAQRRPELVFVMPAATPSLFARLKTLLARARLPASLDVRLILGRSHEAMAAAQTVLVASGTATLEVALHRRPMVIAYRMAWGSYQIMKRMAYLPWIGLPNILCEDSVVPEFIQHAATPEAMGRALIAQIDDARGADRLAERFAALHEALRCGCGVRAAQVLMELGSRPQPALR